METLPKTTPTLTHDPKTQTLSLQPQPLPPRTPAPTAHLLRVHAAALTSQELAWPEPAAARPFPVPGYEVSGTVLEAPAGGSPFPPGSEVVARTAFDRPGNARAYGVALAAEMGPRPRGLGWAEAATVPLSGLTAWQGLFVHGGLSAPGVGAEGKQQEDGEEEEEKQEEEDEQRQQRRMKKKKQRVLVTAAAGGVGLFAVQLAKLAGAYVVGTCGAANVDFVRSLGADEVLDYRATDLRSWVGVGVGEDGTGTAATVDGSSGGGGGGSNGRSDDSGRKFDLVLDCVGGSTLEQAWTTAREGGTVISVAEPAEGRRPREGVAEGVGSKWFIVEADGDQLRAITRLLEEGRCQAVCDSVFRLEEYEKAFDKVRSGHLRGKVVLSIGD